MAKVELTLLVKFPDTIKSVDGKDSTNQVGGVFEMTEEDIVSLINGDARVLTPITKKLKTQLDIVGRKLYLK